MEGVEEAYFQDKPSRINARKSKFGKAGRCGATLRREPETDVYCRRAKKNGEAVVLKHYSTTNEWDRQKLNEHCERYLPDGGLEPSACVSATSDNERGRWSRSVIADRRLRGPGIKYSLNKRNRWNMSELLQRRVNEIRAEDRDVDVVVIERSIANFSGLEELRNKADVTNLTSSTLNPNAKNECPQKKKKKKKKNKRSLYSYSTDLLGLSQKRPENDENANPETPAMPQVTYEICTPRCSSQYPNYHQPKHDRKYLRETHKSERKSKHKNQGTTKLNDINWMDEDAELPEVTTRANSGCRERCDRFQIGSWMKEPTKKKEKKQKSCRKVGNGRRTMGEEKKDKCRIVVSPLENKAVETEPDSLTEEQILAAQAALNSILDSDQERTMRIKLDAELFRLVEQKFSDLGSSVISYGSPGYKIHSGQCQPAKYALEIPSVCEDDANTTWPPCFLAIQTEFFQNACIENYCFGRPDSYVAHVKTVVISEEERFKTFSDEWNQLLRRELQMGYISIVNGIQDVEGVFDKATSTLRKLAERLRPALTETCSQPSGSCGNPSSSYLRAVKRKATELARYRCETSGDFGPDEIDTDSASPESESSAVAGVEAADFCGICFVMLKDYSRCIGSALNACNHWFCKDCWLQHIAYSSTLGVPHSFYCPATNCPESVDDVSLMTLLPGHVIAKHRRLRKEDWIAKSREIHVCPVCQQTVRVFQQRTSAQQQGPYVQSLGMALWCQCGTSWCPECNNATHWPASCKAAAAYLDERKLFYTSLDLITSVKGQRCPFCRLPMEKNGGCKMMTCRCGRVFCWKCLRDPSVCQYKCNPYGSDNYEVFMLDDVNNGFGSAVTLAAKTCFAFEHVNERRERLKVSRRTVTKVLERNTIDEKPFVLDEKLLAYVDDAILFCDAIRYILQYLHVQIAHRHPLKPTTLRRLSKVAKRLQSVLVCSERHLLYHQNKISDIDMFKAMFCKFEMAADEELGKIFRLIHSNPVGT